MKDSLQKPSRASVLLVVLVLSALLLFSACNNVAGDSIFGSLAHGGYMPADYAIASGNLQLMLQCLAELGRQYTYGDISSSDRGEIALDMIDLIAVISQAILSLLPYIDVENPDDPISLTLEDFLSSADIESLSQIAEDGLMEAALLANIKPAPLQALWGVLGLFAYMYDQYGVPPYDPADLTDEDLQKLQDWADLARDMGLELDRSDFVALMDRWIALVNSNQIRNDLPPLP